MMHIAIATVPASPLQPHQPQTVSYDGITMPVIVGIGAFGVVSVALFKIAWQLSTEKGRIDKNAEKIRELNAQIEKAEEKQEKLKREIERDFKTELISTENNISRSLEVFMTRIQGSIEVLQKDIGQIRQSFTDGLNARNETVNRLYAKTESNTKSLIEMENKLNQQGIAFHLRNYGDNPPSSPANYS